MDEPNKNSGFVKDLQTKLNELKVVREHFSRSYRNREASLVITKLQEAEFWIQQQIETLK